MSTFDIIFWLNLVFIVALAAGEWLLMRRLSPRQKKWWHPRLLLIILPIIGAFLIAMGLSQGAQWRSLLFLVAVLMPIGFLWYIRIRVCEDCGTIVQPQIVLRAAHFCPKCGTPLSPSKLGDPKPSA
jgi:hypothetical protein